MHEIKVDIGQNRLVPHPKVIEAYNDEKRGNGYTRVRTAFDDTYENFYNACRKKPFQCQAKTIIRTRTILNGKLREIIYFFCHIQGENTAGQTLELPIWLGVYDEPIFNKKLDKETDNFVVENVRDHVRRYEWELNDENLDMVFSYADDATVLMVKESPEIMTGYPITDIDGFKTANFIQLLEMGRSKRTLSEVTQLAKAALKSVENKGEAEKQAEIAEQTGDVKSAEEIKAVAQEQITEGDELELDDKVEVSVKRKKKK